MSPEQINQLFDEVKQHLIKDYPFLQDWHFKIDNAKKRAGVCRVSKKIIGISYNHLINNSEEIIKDTLLHEFAHAIAFQLHGEATHGMFWKTIAKKIGATPRASGHFNLPDAPWKLVLSCFETEKIEVIAPRYRINKRIKHFFLRGNISTKGKLYFLPSRQVDDYLAGKLAFKELNFYQ
ncbi:MAG: SprT-like domain-containing protein [Gammaproteobacteria bacterium]|nr:SprT-like domain-containing protein [Gammaproteobacteria bacterium]MDH5629033.1 SprT-like domain-containing protein [Gammaproteobacteria bacterium]